MEAMNSNRWLHISMKHLLNKNLEKSIYNYENLLYYSFSYDKNMLCYNDEETRLYRTVIYSYPEEKVLFYFPPKALEYKHFKQYYPEFTPSIVVKEYINGDMVNLSYDERCDKWRLSTQSKVKDIVNRFKECLNIDDNHYTPLLEYVSKKYSYTFTLKNNYIKDNGVDKFYLVSVYQIDDNNVKYIPCIEYENWEFLKNMNGLIYFPQQYDVNSYEETHFINEDLDGYMLIDTYTGCKTKILNADLLSRKTMSLINPFYAYEYLCIRRINRLYEYNRIYRSTRNIRDTVHNEYERLITVIHQHYLSRYIFKNNIIMPKKYERYVEQIHKKVYIPSLRKENKEKITRNKVKEYLNILNPCELLYLLYQ